MKVLLCDDEIHVRSILERRFVASGWEVVTANNGSHGVEVARDQQPDVIVIDYNMPVMNGGEAAVALHKAPSTAHIPIVMLSGQAHLFDESATTHVVRFIPKPFSALQVIEAAAEILEEKNSREDAA